MPVHKLMREQNLGKTWVRTQTTGASAMQPLSERPPVVRIFSEVPLVGNLIANDRSVEILVPEFVLKQRLPELIQGRPLLLAAQFRKGHGAPKFSAFLAPFVPRQNIPFQCHILEK
ncbi:hypothetical protein [Methylocystis rosea]|uniref:hypothetical protein n=1 Tax=Methylocystis rosea TaxID=173366 RepID=UPI00039F7AA2|nr:hypothetical protein [Methylocystis rosea]